MSEARAIYESELDTANAVHTAAMHHLMDDYNRTCDKAWYDYQVRTGMIPLPDPAEASKEQDDVSQGSGERDGFDGTVIPVREADDTGDIHPGEVDTGSQGGRTADEGIAPDPR